MSDNLQKNDNSQEVDLQVVFNQFGKVLNKAYNIFVLILKTLFSGLIYTLKPFVNNIVILLIIVAIAAGIGFAIDKTKTPIYESQMIVKPYFNSEYSLVNNIDMYNALLSDQDYDKIQDIFEISDNEAKSILSFSVEAGPETENHRLFKYNEFIKSFDSVNAARLSYEDFIENRSVYNGDVFEIEVLSTKKTIFKSLERGLKTAFYNENSLKSLKKRDSLVGINVLRIKNSLKEVDSLKKVYIEVMQEESKTDNTSSGVISKDGVSLVQERIATREYDLLEKQMSLQQELSRYESQKVQQDELFDTVSNFQEIGTKHKDFFKNYTLVFPILSFLLLILGYIFIKVFKFIKEYE